MQPTDICGSRALMASQMQPRWLRKARVARDGLMDSVDPYMCGKGRAVSSLFKSRQMKAHLWGMGCVMKFLCS